MSDDKAINNAFIAPISVQLLMMMDTKASTVKRVTEKSRGGKPKKVSEGLKPVTPTSVHMLAKKSFTDFVQVDKMIAPLIVEQSGMSAALRFKLLVQITL